MVTAPANGCTTSSSSSSSSATKRSAYRKPRRNHQAPHAAVYARRCSCVQDTRGYVPASPVQLTCVVGASPTMNHYLLTSSSHACTMLPCMPVIKGHYGCHHAMTAHTCTPFRARMSHRHQQSCALQHLGLPQHAGVLAVMPTWVCMSGEPCMAAMHAQAVVLPYAGPRLCVGRPESFGRMTVI